MNNGGLYSCVKPGLYFVRRSTQTLWRKRVYADTQRDGVLYSCVGRHAYLADIRKSGLRTISGRWIYFICRVNACVYAEVAGY